MATNGSATIDTDWSINLDLGTSSTKKLTIKTKDSFVDRDIVVNASASGLSTAAAATVTATKQATTPTVAIDAANDNILASAATTTKPSTGYYAAVKATAPATKLTITKTVDTAGYLSENSQITASAATTAKTGNDYYIPIKSASVNAGTTTVDADKKVTRGTFDISEGYINETDGDLAAATFGSAATSGIIYVDISETNAAPALKSGDFLYINKGYTDNLMISLAKLVPDDATIEGSGANYTSGDIRNGVTAYDKDGKLVTGSMLDSSTTGSDATSAATASAEITQTFKEGTYRTTAATGYTLRVDASASASDTGATATKTVKAGYLAADKTATAKVTGASDSDSSKLYILDGVITTNISGGTSSGTINAGKQIKIAKGYYTDDTYYTAQSYSTTTVGESLTHAVTSDSTHTSASVPHSFTWYNSTTEVGGAPYVKITGTGSAGAGKLVTSAGASATADKYVKIFDGAFSIDE